MADIQLANHYRAQLIMHGPSGLPTDRFVTNYVFGDLAGAPVWDHEGAHGEIARLLGILWTTVVNPGATLISYISDDVTQFELRTYHLLEDLPRTPVITDALGWTGLSASQALPREVAVVASLQTSTKGPRGRGRFYVGPLTTQAIQSDDLGPTVQPNLRQIVANACEAMHAEASGDTGQLTWGVLSNTGGFFSPVIGGWADDAFDTQRSRGREPSARVTWPAAA